VGVSFKNDTRGALFAALREDASILEEELGGSLRWEDRPDSGWAYFEVSLPSDPADESLWEEQHAWLQEKLEAIHRVMEPRLKGRVVAE